MNTSAQGRTPTCEPVAGRLSPRLLARRLAGVRIIGACALVSLASLGACGFQLRGDVRLPFRRLYAGFARGSGIGAEFRSLMRIARDTAVVDRIEEADARLEVLNETREREIVGFTSSGRPREFQLRIRFRFRVLDAQGLPWLEATELVLRRDITSTDVAIVSKQQEEDMLFRDMEADLVQQLLRRLAAMPRR